MRRRLALHLRLLLDRKKRCVKKGRFNTSLVYFVGVSDLALCRRSDGDFDLAFDEDKGDLLLSETLENAVVISIGSYARERRLGNNANLSPVIGGWWGDSIDEIGTLGGYLYEAFPGKLTDDTARSVKDLVAEALAWMVDDAVASSVDCSANISGENIVVGVVIAKPDGVSESFSYEIKWSASNEI